MRAAATSASLLRLRLAPQLSLNQCDGGDVRISSALGTVTLRCPSPGVIAALQALGGAGATLDELADLALSIDAGERLYPLYLHIETLSSRGMLQHTVLDDRQPFATIAGIGRGYRFDASPVDPEQPYLLSRFALCRRVGRRVVLECPLGLAQIVFDDARAATLVARLAQPLSVREAAALPDAPSEDAVAACFLFLRNAWALTNVADGCAAEDGDPEAVQWDFHDLLLHSRSRFGRHSEPFGATFRVAATTPPLPAVRPSNGVGTVALEVPDLARVATADPPLTQAIEERSSVRAYGDRPITVRQLGEFLYRVARVRATGSLRIPGCKQRMEVTSRPYPTGGTCYELELYPVVDCCESLARGMYHYDPRGHRLELVRPHDEAVESLLRYAGLAATGAHPQILLVLAARFGRVGWKYDSISYATTLKHVGVLVQTMYLVATAMGLAGCALGSGDPDAFCSAAGTNYLAESSVGEFMLGSLPAEGMAA